MREIITLAVGQCGNQVSYKFWEAIAQEHGICPDEGTWKGDDDVQIMKSDVYFNEIPGGRFVPRSVMIDLEPGVLGQVQSCPKMGKLFNPDYFCGAQNGAGNNWAKGHYSDGPEIVEEVLDQIRKNVEMCESLQGFQMMHSLGGGTGSGLGSLLLQKLSEEYSDRMRFNFSVFPGSTNGGTSDVVTEPYNAILTLNNLIEYSQASFTVENSALNRICQKNLKIAHPSFNDINHIIAQVMSNTTASLRFPGYQNNSDIRKLSTNLIPFPRLHFLLQSQAPLLTMGNSQFERLGVKEVAAQMFDSRSMLTDAGDIQQHGKIITASCLFRGKDLSAIEAEKVIAQFRDKKSDSFVEWIPDNMSNSLCKVPAAWNQNSDITGTFLCNSTMQAQSFANLSDNFEKMFKRKAYFHWYQQEGMDELEFTEALSNVRDLIDEYQMYENAQANEGESDDEEMEDMESVVTSKIPTISKTQKLIQSAKQKMNQSFASQTSTQAGSNMGGSL